MLCTHIPQLAPESQAFYEAWFEKQYGPQPDPLQMLDHIIDLDQRLLDFVAPAYSEKGAPARGVARLLRALLPLFVKGLRSENFLVHDELKNHLLSPWFVRLERDEAINDSFRVAPVRLRQRLAQRIQAEGSFAHRNCQHGLDSARYYGQSQMLLQSYWTAAAMNLKKAGRWMQARLKWRQAQAVAPAPS